MTDYIMKKTTARNGLDLATMIRQDAAKKQYKIDFKLYGDSQIYREDEIYGQINSKGFAVKFMRDKFLSLQLPSASIGVEDNLIPVLSAAMGSAPICTYDLKQSRKDNGTRVVEWDIYNPEKRLSMIKSGEAHYKGTTITNLNGDKVRIPGKKAIPTKDNYLECKGSFDYSRSADEEVVDTSIPKRPIDRICYDALNTGNPFEKYNELELYYSIFVVGKQLERLDGAETAKKSSRLRQEYGFYYSLNNKLLLQTVRFGTDLCPCEGTNQVNTTIIFTKWYSYFSNYCSKEISTSDWNSFKKAFANSEDTSNYLPSGSWTDTLSPAIKAVLQRRQNQ